MRMIIRFKSGFELPITCDSFSIKRHPMTNEIAEYDIKGIRDNKLIFFRSEDIECIFRDMTEELEKTKRGEDSSRPFANPVLFGNVNAQNA